MIQFKHFQSIHRLCGMFDGIASKALTTPANTEELIELQAYVKEVRTKQMPEMEKQLVTCKDRLAFLVDFTSFTPREMRMNSEIFKWNARMDRVFEDHERIVDVKTGQYQDGLKVSCRDFWTVLLERLGQETFRIFSQKNLFNFISIAASSWTFHRRAGRIPEANRRVCYFQRHQRSQQILQKSASTYK